MKLLLRNLWYFRGVNLAVIAGMAVATAVLTGALLVGDSVRGSLADLALQRLGPVDFALISTRFFDQSLAARINGSGPGKFNGVIAPAALVRGGAATESGNARTADVQINAVGPTANGLAPLAGPLLPVPAGGCIINGELATALAPADIGKTVLLSVPTQSDAPRESALARRSRNDVQNELRTSISRVESQPGFLSLFNPNGGQRVPRNAWVNLADLQDAIDQPGRVNALLAHIDQPGAAGANDDSLRQLNERLRQVVRLEDFGLSIVPAGNNEATVIARETYIAPPAIAAARGAAEALHIPLREVSVNLINTVSNVSASSSLSPVIRREGRVEGRSVELRNPPSGPSPQPSPPSTGEREPDRNSTHHPDALLGSPTIHYAVGAGITSLDEGTLGDDEIAVNQWTADRLHAKPGDKLKIDFYMRLPGGDLTDASKALPPAQLIFTVKYVLPMTGLGADPKLPPDYKGLTDAKSVADWDPPEGLKIDKTLVTKADEKYWDQYRAAPKLFVSFATAKKLWGGVYGDVTGLRIPASRAEEFKGRFLAEIKPETMGLVFQPIKSEQLAAASGGTDFGMFFLMFSFFLIVAAALLVAMLFRLNVEGRARQLGLLAAVGFSPWALRRMTLAEGMLLALIGGAIGLGGAIGYTWLILLGLRTWWVGAIGTTSTTLHLIALTLIYGLAGSLLVALLAILWAVWRVGKTQPARLLAGGFYPSFVRAGQGRWPTWSGIVGAAIGLALVGAALAGKISAEAGFGGGALLLCGCLALLGGVLRPRRHAGAAFVGFASLARLGLRNAARHTARGVLSVGLIGFAAFTLITVAAVKQNGVKDPDDIHSETGGYRLILSADIPLTGDMNTQQGRRLLGIDHPDDPIYAGAHFTPLRRWAGQDISCLNLTKPNSPTILGLPPEFIARGAFMPGDTLQKADNFWTLLDSDQGEDIPVIADSDTVEYVLQISLGDTIAITDQLGTPRKLKLVATVSRSIFQGQLLMSDGNFRKLFPAVSGFAMALIDMPGVQKDQLAARQVDLARDLSSKLDVYSVSVDTTESRLAAYQNVQNTYLETFQTLGALGLMLGTLGLAVVLIRTVIERRAELALLASLGFTRMARIWLMLAENASLLVLGLTLGAGSAVIGILPVVWRDSRPINVPSLAITLGAVLAIGLTSSVVAVLLSGAHVTPADLRRE